MALSNAIYSWIALFFCSEMHLFLLYRMRCKSIFNKQAILDNKILILKLCVFESCNFGLESYNRLNFYPWSHRNILQSYILTGARAWLTWSNCTVKTCSQVHRYINAGLGLYQRIHAKPDDYVFSNRTRAAGSFDFEITRMTSDQIVENCTSLSSVAIIYGISTGGSYFPALATNFAFSRAFSQSNSPWPTLLYILSFRTRQWAIFLNTVDFKKTDKNIRGNPRISSLFYAGILYCAYH